MVTFERAKRVNAFEKNSRKWPLPTYEHYINLKLSPLPDNRANIKMHFYALSLRFAKTTVSTTRKN